MPEKIIDISEVSDILNQEIKQNTLVLGIDVAQKRTGLCLIRTTKTKLYVESFYSIDIKGASKGSLHVKLIEYLQKCREIRKILPEFSKTLIKRLIIEDCYFGLSVWTTKILSKYATVSFFVFNKWADEAPDPIQPTSVRKRVSFVEDKGGFHYEKRIVKGKSRRKKVWDRKPLDLKKQIINSIEDRFKLTLEDDNHADAFFLALSGVIKDV